jgi:Tfp pilus assembly protein PilO
VTKSTHFVKLSKNITFWGYKVNGITIFLLICVALLGVAFYFIYGKFKAKETENTNNQAQLKKYEAKYSRIIDVDSEVEKSLNRKNQLNNDIQALQLDYQKNTVFFKF